MPEWGGIILARAISIEHLWFHLLDGINVWWGLDEEGCNTFAWLCNGNVDPIVVIYEILVLDNVWLRDHLLLHSQSSMRVLMHILETLRELRMCSRWYPWARLRICRFWWKSLHWIRPGYVLVQVHLVLEPARWESRTVLTLLQLSVYIHYYHNALRLCPLFAEGILLDLVALGTLPLLTLPLS